MRAWAIIAAAVLLAACGDEPPLAGPGPPGGPIDDVRPPPGHGAPAPGPLRDGRLSGWLEQGRMLTPRSGHCALQVHDEMVLIGGVHRPDPAGPEEPVMQMAAAKIQVGELKGWNHIGSTPAPIERCTAAVHDGLITLVHDGKISGARLPGPDWTTLGALPAGFESFGGHAFWHEDKLYISGFDADGGVVLRGRYFNDQIGGWEIDRWLNQLRTAAFQAHDDRYLFVLGGIRDGEVNWTTVRSTFQSTGAMTEGIVLDTWLSRGIHSAGAALFEQQLFVIGGKDDDGDRQQTSSALIDGDGYPAMFIGQEHLPAPRSSPSVTIADGFMFVSGGRENGESCDTVYTAQAGYALADGF